MWGGARARGVVAGIYAITDARLMPPNVFLARAEAGVRGCCSIGIRATIPRVASPRPGACAPCAHAMAPFSW